MRKRNAKDQLSSAIVEVWNDAIAQSSISPFKTETTATNFQFSSIKISLLFGTIYGIDTNLALVRALRTHACDSDWHVKIKKVQKKIAVGDFNQRFRFLLETMTWCEN